MGEQKVASAFFATDPGSDFVSIRGKKLNLHELMNERLRDPAYVERLAHDFRSALPFPHLVVEGWFSPDLLTMALEEFDLFSPEYWRSVTGAHEHTFRSRPGVNFGPAAQIYFGLVNSGWFLDVLSKIVSIPDLIPDPYLYGGGMHETRNGGRFGIHRDFDVHLRNGLRNELVILTYLNHKWNSSWDGDLELWNESRHQRTASIIPEFGRSIIMRHGPASYHGHPRPMNAPEGVVRRSLATYYYTNQRADELRSRRVSSIFLPPESANLLKRVGKQWTPPILWSLMKHIATSRRGREQRRAS